MLPVGRALRTESQCHEAPGDNSFVAVDSTTAAPVCAGQLRRRRWLRTIAMNAATTSHTEFGPQLCELCPSCISGSVPASQRGPSCNGVALIGYRGRLSITGGAVLLVSHERQRPAPLTT